LRNPGYTDDFVPLIPDARLHVFETAAHMGNIECAEEFNTNVLRFLTALAV
jgi:pimeloyl-ACP methyl ester carboxylesterase